MTAKGDIVGHQRRSLDSKFVQAGLGHVHGIGLQLRRGRLQFTAPVACLIQKLAGVAQQFIDLSQSRAELIFFKLEQAFAHLAGVALGFEISGLLFEMGVFRFPLQLLGRRGFNLGGKSVQSLTHFDE